MHEAMSKFSSCRVNAAVAKGSETSRSCSLSRVCGNAEALSRGSGLSCVLSVLLREALLLSMHTVPPPQPLALLLFAFPSLALSFSSQQSEISPSLLWAQLWGALWPCPVPGVWQRAGLSPPGTWEHSSCPPSCWVWVSIAKHNWGKNQAYECLKEIFHVWYLRLLNFKSLIMIFEGNPVSCLLIPDEVE